jgi:type 2 lantibiotic biosynthesis protein LanM
MNSMQSVKMVGLQSDKAINALWIKERNMICSDVPSVHRYENIDRWRGSRNLLNEDTFKFRLEYDEVSQNKFNYIIGNKFSSIDTEQMKRFVERSEWFMVFNESLAYLNYQGDLFKEINWGLAVRNFIYWAREELTAFISAINQDAFLDIPHLVRKLIDSLAIDLVEMIMKSAVLELNIKKLEGKLTGSTPEERFKSFLIIQFKNDDNFLSFYSEYIVLARLLSQKTISFVKNIKQSIQHYIHDQEIIDNDFKMNGLIKYIKPGMGDTHQGGKTVIEFVFDSNQSIFYKPKNLIVSKAYNNLVEWINKHSELLDFPTVKTIYRDSYAWEIKINKEECNSGEQVKRFYKRFGQITGLMHCLRGGDFHFENIIANGESPVIIDLETLVQQHPPFKLPDIASITAKYESMESVIFTCLLPNRIYNSPEDNVGIDMSALKGDDQTLPYKMLVPDHHGTDEMTYTLKEVVMQGGDENIPVLNNQLMDYSDYKQYIYTGFKATCEFMHLKIDQLLSNGLLETFAKTPVRVIPRPTLKYASILLESLHPDYLRNSLDRERMLENMWSNIFKQKQIAKHEIEDMVIGDIPIFFTIPESVDLTDSRGELIKDFFDVSSYRKLVERIQNLTKEEIEQQLSWIKVALTDYKRKPSSKTRTFDSDLKRINQETLIEEAEKIGKYLIEDAYLSQDGRTIAWLDVIAGNETEQHIEPLSTDFYDGLSGLALFYYYLYDVTREKRYMEIFMKIVNSLEENYPESFVPSASTGSVSILQAICRIPLSNGYFDTILEKQIAAIEDNIENLDSYDYLTGTAGIINSILYLLERSEDVRLKELVKKLGDKLVDQIHSVDIQNIMGGMSHGASGLSYVLFKLNSFIPNKTYNNMAIELLERDRDLFNEEQSAWLDKRHDQTKCSHLWCHGSTGIGISRLLISRYYTDDMLSREVSIAANNLWKQGYKLDDCLCHGNMGDLELFILMENDHKDTLVSQLLNDMYKNGEYHIRSLPGFAGKGLFTGLAGVGYQLLRASNPKGIPSVLF